MVSFNFFKSRNFLPVKVMRIIYLSLFQAISHYDLLVWGGLNENAVRPLILFQRKIVRICSGRNDLLDSTGENVKLLNVLPIEIVYKKVYKIVYKNLLYVIIKNYENFYTRKKREFVDYSGRNYYNSMALHVKKLI
jgi:hypothetical protein